MLGLELIDDGFEVPWEGEHIGVFLMREFGVNAESGVFIGLTDLILLFIFADHGSI